MLVGALFWGMSADIIGRKFAFNFSLVFCSVFAIVAGASPNWIVLGFFVCLSSFGGGGNLVLDTAVFLEYLPSRQQWMLTLMAAWWGRFSMFVHWTDAGCLHSLGIGQLIAGVLAWAFLPNFSCDDPSLVPGAAPCTKSNNQGWRYVWYASGALVFVMSLLRITVIRLKETPKFLIGEGRDFECVETLQAIAQQYNRPCSLTVEKLKTCETLATDPAPSSAHARAKWSLSELTIHIKGLFATRKIALSTTLIWFSWTLIGLAYPLYNVFLPSYLASRGATFGQTSAYTTWRNYTLVNFSGIWGPVLAGFMCATRLGRKYTMVIGALVTMAFFFAYTQVRTEVQNIVFTCVSNFCLNVYYGTLYAYTPEVLPSAHRGTGNGIAVGWNRVMGILSAVVATVADVSFPCLLRGIFQAR
jgi:MFS family permease